MILFKPEFVDLILKGKKTQTRRVGKRRWRVGSVHQCQTQLFEKPFARVRIESVCLERLRFISEADAVAEGFFSREAFLRTFQEINPGFGLDGWVWVVQFGLMEACQGRLSG